MLTKSEGTKIVDLSQAWVLANLAAVEIAGSRPEVFAPEMQKVRDAQAEFLAYLLSVTDMKSV